MGQWPALLFWMPREHIHNSRVSHADIDALARALRATAELRFLQRAGRKSRSFADIGAAPPHVGRNTFAEARPPPRF